MKIRNSQLIYVVTLDTVPNYKAAIYTTCKVLLKQKIVTERYYQAIINNIKVHGGYFYLGEGVCMPHARTEDGALETGLCILKLNNSVNFKGNKVNLFFTLAARNKNDHFELMKKIAAVCSRNDILWKIHMAKSGKDIIKIMELENEEKDYDSM